MYNEAVDFAIQTGKISASLIQRRFRFGYNRAARILDLLEERGVIGPPNGSKPREVLIKTKDDLIIEDIDNSEINLTENSINNIKSNDNPNMATIIMLVIIILVIISLIKSFLS